jgi:hypothetical protein
MLVLAIGSQVQAQCSAMDDGFDVGCCVAPTITLPPFPGVTMSANWAELARCTPVNQNLVTVTLSPPSWAFCDYALIQVTIAFPGGEIISGLLAAKYIRTFRETSGFASGKVYRFLVNGDLSAIPAGTPPACSLPLPRCCLTGIAPHFDGHIDYHCDLLSSTATVSMSLTHHTGCIAHAPWSCVPMSGPVAHNESSYHLVGPAPFVFAPGALTPAGPLLGDAVRTSILSINPFIYVCATEQRFGPAGTLASSVPTNGCAPAACNASGPCSSAPCTAANSCYEDTSITYGVCCAGISGPFATVPILGTPVAGSGMLGIRLGAWGPLPQYPSGASLRTYFGVMTYTPPTACPPINSAIHAAVGVSTSNVSGQPFNLAPTCLPPPPLLTHFMDLQNVLPLTSTGILSPGYGCLAASDVVWSFNTL